MLTTSNLGSFSRRRTWFSRPRRGIRPPAWHKNSNQIRRQKSRSVKCPSPKPNLGVLDEPNVESELPFFEGKESCQWTCLSNLMRLFIHHPIPRRRGTSLYKMSRKPCANHRATVCQDNAQMVEASSHPALRFLRQIMHRILLKQFEPRTNLTSRNKRQVREASDTPSKFREREFHGCHSVCECGSTQKESMQILIGRNAVNSGWSPRLCRFCW